MLASWDLNHSSLRIRMGNAVPSYSTKLAHTVCKRLVRVTAMVWLCHSGKTSYLSS